MVAQFNNNERVTYRDLLSYGSLLSCSESASSSLKQGVDNVAKAQASLFHYSNFFLDKALACKASDTCI